MKRITVTVTDEQHAQLLELSQLDSIPVSQAVRASLSAMLSTQLELARFLRNPAADRGDMLAVVDGMEALLARIVGGASGAGAAGGEAPADPPRPPSGNTGANQP